MKSFSLKMATLCLALFIPWYGMAESKEFSFKDYDEAKKSENYVRFDMASTKLGLFTSHFSGYLKKFTVSGQISGNKIENAWIEFPVKEMDTDINGRNEKMWNQCLDLEKNPLIKIKLSKAILLNGSDENIPATINVRGGDHTINLTINANKKDQNFVIDIKGEISIKDMNIPDPSIAIASVRDSVELNAHFILNEIK